MIVSDTLDPGNYTWPFCDLLRRLLDYNAADLALQHAQVHGDATAKVAAELDLERAQADAVGFNQDLGEAVMMMIRHAAFHFPETLAACLLSVEPIRSLYDDVQELAGAVVELQAETGVTP